MKWIAPVAAVFVILVHVAHPLFHHLEGGSLDAAINYMTVYAMHWAR